MDIISKSLEFIGIQPPPYLHWIVIAVLLIASAPLAVIFHASARPRQEKVQPYRERVLILGASSGVGAAIAVSYAERGCRDLVLVARRREELEKVVEQCEEAAKKGAEWNESGEAPGWEKRVGTTLYHVVTADCTSPEDVVRVRSFVEEELGGLDTLHICFGVSALRPLLGIAGVDPVRPSPPANAPPGTKVSQSIKQDADVNGLVAISEATRKACEVNVTATAVVLGGLTPLMQRTSMSPAIALISSVAAIVPAPTRSLYGATKAAQLVLFRAFALECATQARPNASVHPRAKVAFVALCPATVKTDFRLSAVDGPPDVSGAFDASWDVKAGGKSDVLTAEDVADRAIDAVDRYQTGEVLFPSKYKHVRLGMVLIPKRIESLAHKKYMY